VRAAKQSPWLLGAIELLAFDDDNWELYNTNEDWSRARDLAAEMPDKLHELQRLWLIEAVKHNVLPIGDGLPSASTRSWYTVPT
jgi:arylsulfatase A-like enzyme